MKYNGLFILLFCVIIHDSMHASYSRSAQECVTYINNTPLHVLIGKNAPFEEMIIDGIKMPTLEAFRHFSIMMRIGSVVEAFREKCKNASNEEYMQAQANIRILQSSFTTIAFLSWVLSQLSENEAAHIKCHLENLSDILNHAAQYHKSTSNVVLPASSGKKERDNLNAVPVTTPAAQHLDFIRKNQLSKLCSYQKLSSGYAEIDASHSVANIMLLIRNPQVLETLQEKYRTASHNDRAKAIKNLNRCRERMANPSTSIAEMREFDSFVQALTSRNRFALKKYLLIGSIITSGIIFVGYKLYNKYSNTPQSQSAAE